MMLRCLKTELRKAFQNKMFFCSLLVGSLISITDVAQNAVLVRRMTRILENSSEISKSAEGFSLFVRWIAVNGVTLGSNLFYFVWPILAAIPYGWSWAEERKSGLYAQIVSRVGRRTYFFSKYWAVFISGGAAVSVPVLANLLINALVCPYCVPTVLMAATPITNGYFLSELYYSAPWIFGLLWCGVDFLWGGVAACMCLPAGTRFRHQVMVLLVPFVSLILLDAVCSMAMSIGSLDHLELSPLRLALAAPASANPGWLLFSLLGIFFSVTFLGGYWEVVKHELN